MILYLVFILLSTSLTALACDKVETSFEKKPVVLCHDKKNNSYLSESCEDIKSCFFQKTITLKYYANQSPGFSLCYQIEGKPFFAHFKGVKGPVSLCMKNGHFVDQESLMLVYKKIEP